MEFKLKSDEDKIVGKLIVEKGFDKNCFIYFETEHMTIKITFDYICNNCQAKLLHDSVGLTKPITSFFCNCGEFDGGIARKGYSLPHIGLSYKQFKKEDIKRNMENDINRIKEKYIPLLQNIKEKDC